MVPFIASHLYAFPLPRTCNPFERCAGGGAAAGGGKADEKLNALLGEDSLYKPLAEPAVTAPVPAPTRKPRTNAPAVVATAHAPEDGSV